MVSIRLPGICGRIFAGDGAAEGCMFGRIKMESVRDARFHQLSGIEKMRAQLSRHRLVVTGELP